MHGLEGDLLLLLLLLRIVATDTNTVDDCLHLADYIRAWLHGELGGGLGGGEGGTLLRWRGREWEMDGGSQRRRRMGGPTSRIELEVARSC